MSSAIASEVPAQRSSHGDALTPLTVDPQERIDSLLAHLGTRARGLVRGAAGPCPVRSERDLARSGAELVAGAGPPARRVRVHRRARREPPRLQLAHRVLRVRRPRRTSRGGRASRRPPAAGAEVALHPAHRSDARGDVAHCRTAARGRRARAAARRPLPVGAADRAGGAQQARVSRSASVLGLSAPDPSLDGVHLMIDADEQVPREYRP